MPKFPKGFGRRKSTANALEDLANAPNAPSVEHSFKVFERPGGIGKSFDGGVKLVKGLTTNRPTTSYKEDNIFEGITGNRGSGASNTNSASTTDNSSRLSAASTAPSSMENSTQEDWRSPHDKPFNDIPVPPIPKSSSTFSLKAAGRSLSWGKTNKTPSPSKDISPPSIPEQTENSGRPRTVTASSYASTATPPKMDKSGLRLSVGGDFAEMFSVGDESKLRSASPEVLPPEPALRSYSANRLNQPPPLHIDKKKYVEPSPYSWSSHHSNEGLINNSSPNTASPPLFPASSNNSAPPVPRHGTPLSATSPFARPQGPVATDQGLRRSSAFNARRQSTLENGDAVDEDARLLRESISASRRMNEPSYDVGVRDSWAAPSSTPYKVKNTPAPSWRGGSVESTPKASQVEDDDNLFESANLAQRFREKPDSPQIPQGPQTKVMTPAQFERYKKDQENLRSVGGRSKDDEDEDETYDDEEDEAEKNKKLAKQRRKQEAHMAVYRQQMMKVTGETAPSAGPSRPPVFASHSTPNLVASGLAEDGEEEDEEVPLGILAAHGFPSKTKPPTGRLSSMGSNPNLRAVAVGGNGNLPVFARNLPQDPYVGAGLVHSTNRESLAFSNAGSVQGGSSRGGLPPGGLVGVIATEERSRAMRRGSPNAQGEYPSLPPSMNGMGMSMPPVGQMGLMGPTNPMMLTPGDQAQIQMSQQMQQFMQMQMQFMQMMTSTGQTPPQNGHMSQQSLGELPRPNSQGNFLRPGSAHQRAYTMLEPMSGPWMQQGYAPSQGGGYAPSIAPSERSNVGLPGRYRPVSHAPVSDMKSRTSALSGTLENWESKNATATVKAVRKSGSGNVSDEDEDAGWEEMKKKREKKRSLWKSKKEPNGLQHMLGYAHAQ